MAAVNGLKVSIIGGRTDASGVSQTTDWDQEEMRMALGALLRPGITHNLLDGTPNPNAFRVRQNLGTDMNVLVGSTVAKVDGLVLRGTSIAGQGSYLLRIDLATITVAVPATDPTNPARYGVYAFVDDAAYAGDASRAYASITCIRGIPAASPATPTALATWSAWALLWEFQLPALATAVTNTILDSATSFDRRVAADLLAQNALESRVFL